MTYIGFLLVFLGIPIVALSFIALRSREGGKALWIALGIQMALALVYTTPWDNYLVATGVWAYAPHRVTGILLGYVPLEEYTFFVLETLLVGLCWRFIARRSSGGSPFRASSGTRTVTTAAVTALWLVSTILFLSGWKPGTYLTITLAWALPPIILQLAYGADILWHERQLVGTAILSLGLYLSAADAVAIHAGIWAIDPAQSTGILIAGLPLEEAVFFFVTVILITFGLTLALSPESRKRLPFKRRDAAAQSGSQQPASAK